MINSKLNFPLICNALLVGEIKSNKTIKNSKIKISVNKSLNQHPDALSLKGKVFKKLKEIGVVILNLFLKIFCCKKTPKNSPPLKIELKPKKKEKPENETVEPFQKEIEIDLMEKKELVDDQIVKGEGQKNDDQILKEHEVDLALEKVLDDKPAEPIQNEVKIDLMGKKEFIDKQIINGEGQKNCRQILKGHEVDITLEKIRAGGSLTGEILMPRVFAQDLHRFNYLFINGVEVFNNKDQSVENIEAACKKIFNVFGPHVSIAASRLLNQVGFSQAIVQLYNAKLEKGPFHTKQGSVSQLEMDDEGESVVLKIKFAFRCMEVEMDLLPDLLQDPTAPKTFMGVEAAYKVSKKDLSDLGVLSTEELEKLAIEQVAPSAESIFSYTKLFPTEKEALEAIGVISL